MEALRLWDGRQLGLLLQKTKLSETSCGCGIDHPTASLSLCPPQNRMGERPVCLMGHKDMRFWQIFYECHCDMLLSVSSCSIPGFTLILTWNTVWSLNVRDRQSELHLLGPRTPTAEIAGAGGKISLSAPHEEFAGPQAEGRLAQG